MGLRAGQMPSSLRGLSEALFDHFVGFNDQNQVRLGMDPTGGDKFGWNPAPAGTNPTPGFIDGCNWTFSPQYLRGPELLVASGGHWATFRAATFTDTATAASGTSASASFVSILTPTLAAQNASVTVTAAASLYIAAAVAAGTNVTITTGGALAFWIDAGDFRNDGVIQNSLGSAAAPSYTYNGDLDTGMYSSGANQLDFATGGNQRFQLAGAQAIIIPGGSAGTPAFVAANNDLNTGFFQATADFLNLATGGVQRANFSVSGMKIGASEANHATTVGTNAISIYTGTAPVGTLASGGSLYVATATDVELNYIDSAGCAQQLSTT